MCSRALAVAALALALGGCTSFELSRVRNEVDRTPGVEVGEGYAVAFGRTTVGALRAGLRLGDDDEQTAAVRAALGHVRKAHVARYHVRSAPPLASVGTPRTVRRYVRRGWTRVVTARDDDAAVWLLARDDKRGDLGRLIVVTLLPDELIVARLDGNLTEAVAAFARQIDIDGMTDLWRADSDDAAPADSTDAPENGAPETEVSAGDS